MVFTSYRRAFKLVSPGSRQTVSLSLMEIVSNISIISPMPFTEILFNPSIRSGTINEKSIYLKRDIGC